MYDLNDRPSSPEFQAANALVEVAAQSASGDEVEVEVDGVESEDDAPAPPLPPPVVDAPIVVLDSDPVSPGLFTNLYALVGTYLMGPVERFKKEPYMELTNRPEAQPGNNSMGLLNFRACNKEKGTIFALHAGSARVSRAAVRPLPFICVTAFNGRVIDFISSLPQQQMSKLVVTGDCDAFIAGFPFPDQSVVWHLVRSLQGLFGQSFCAFVPTPFDYPDPTIRPDIVFYCHLLLCTLVGASKKPALYFMNYFGIDIRVPWSTYEIDTGVPRHEMIEGDWWMRMKVSQHQGGSRVRHSLAATSPPLIVDCPRRLR